MSQLNNDEFIKKIKEKFDSIDKKLASIENNISKLLDMQKNVNKNAEKMGEHIDFVENVYDNVKNPLGYICNKVSYLVGSDNYSLEDVNKKGVGVSVSESESERRVKEEEEEDKLTSDYNSDFEEFETFSHFENDEVDASIYN
jgi:predicted ribosome quality control (RQC) complex YloA/Tae2 family protein